MENPFRFGEPATGGDLHGRDELLDRVAARARSGRPTVLAGPRGAGLTSLGRELARRMRADGREVRRVELAPELGPTAVREALLPALRDLPGEAPVHLVVDGARRLAEELPSGLVRRLASTSPPDGRVVPLHLLHHAPSAPRLLRRSGADDDSGAVVRVGPLPLAAWLPFVLERFLETDRWIANEQVESAVSLTRGHPGATLRLLHVLWTRIPAGSRVPSGGDEEAFRTVLAREAGRLDDRLASLTPNQRRTLAGLARAGPRARPYSEDFVAACELGSPSSVQRALQALEEEYLVEAVDGELRLTDPLLEARLRRRAAGRGG